MAPLFARRTGGSPAPVDGVSLPEGLGASGFFYELVASACERFPALREAHFPASAAQFRTGYAEALVRFEAVRAANDRRAEIARWLTARAHERLLFRRAGSALPFDEYLASPAGPVALERVKGTRPGLAAPSLIGPRGELRGQAAVDWVNEQFARHVMTEAAARGLCRFFERRADADGLDLGSLKFAILGAGAELAPVRTLLEAGAMVLWVDVTEPPAELRSGAGFSGTLVFVPGGLDLLTRTAEVVRAVDDFAAGGRVHLGLFAYAGGAAREWRLTSAMNGVARHLARSTLGSVGLYISPTTPAVLQPEDVREVERRAREPVGWQNALHAAGLLPNGPFTFGNATVNRSIVPTQGISYQAAQYLDKTLFAESMAAFGVGGAGDQERVVVSANVAPITRTRSLSHAIFETAFVGADSFGVDIFDPPRTRSIASALLLNDLLDSSAPCGPERSYPDAASRGRALFSQQVHGGVYTVPYAFDRAIAAALVIGLGREPRRLPALLSAANVASERARR